MLDAKYAPRCNFVDSHSSPRMTLGKIANGVGPGQRQCSHRTGEANRGQDFAFGNFDPGTRQIRTKDVEQFDQR
jgi:hypothetical protein